MELKIVDRTQEDVRDALGIRKHRQEELQLKAKRLFFEMISTEGTKKVDALSRLASEAENLEEFTILYSTYEKFEDIVLKEPMTHIMLAKFGDAEFGRKGMEEVDKEWEKLQNT